MKDELPDNFKRLFEKKPPIDPDVLRDEGEDIKWIRIKRFQLLPYLNKIVKFKGTIVMFDSNTIFHEPNALLANVQMKDIEVTHLWVKSNLLKNFCLYDRVQCKGEVYCYEKNENFIALSIKNISTIRRIMK